MSAHYMAASVHNDGYLAGMRDRIAGTIKRGEELSAVAGSVYCPRGMASASKIWRSGYINAAFLETEEEVAVWAEAFARRARAA